jgi:copper chaperone NosL
MKTAGHNKTVKNFVAILSLSISMSVLVACGEHAVDSTPLPPQALTRDDTGYFCGMIVEDHTGPKSQIRLADGEALWFTSVRDGIAFTLLPEETRAISAFYVFPIDGDNWDHPEQWLDKGLLADQAWYVIESARRGGMGAEEAIPFKVQAAAQDFAKEHGGRVVRLAEIPSSYILGPDS